MTREVLPTNLGPLVAALARVNCELWHHHNRARSTIDAEVAAAKRAIDHLNAERHQLIEQIDALVAKLAQKRNPHG